MTPQEVEKQLKAAMYELSLIEGFLPANLYFRIDQARRKVQLALFQCDVWETESRLKEIENDSPV